MPESTRSQLHHDLKAVADRLREFGWCRGILRAPNGKCCLVGAVEYAGIPTANRAHVVRALAERLGNVEKSAISTVAEWNDRYCESQEIAIALVEEVAEATP